MFGVMIAVQTVGAITLMALTACVSCWENKVLIVSSIKGNGKDLNWPRAL